MLAVYYHRSVGCCIGLWFISDYYDINTNGGIMREVKFRAWDSIEKKMWDPIIGYEGVLMSPSRFGAFVAYPPYEDPLMQFTGLKDVNGLDIYENDVVEFTYWWFDGNAAESTLTGTIVYSDHFMSFQLKGVKNKEWQQHTGYMNDTNYLTPFSELNFDDADFSVIGNIYENPDLID